MMLLVAPLVGVAPAGGQSDEGNSFRSWNFPDHYIRHRDNLGRIDKIVASDKLGRKDGTFRIVPGLAGQCRSFESVNYPGHFLRHQGYRVKLAPRANDEVFRKDATFCVRTGLANSQARSFESFNFPATTFATRTSSSGSPAPTAPRCSRRTPRTSSPRR